jgi:EVE domain
MDERNYWIGVVSRDHVAIGVAGGFTQLNHGKAGPLERMRAGDGFVFYSPRTSHPDGAPLQAFTALGRVRGGTVYRADLGTSGTGFAPFRLAVEYLPARDAPIKPLLEDLSFIRSKTHWGAAFRFGFLRVPAADFARIAAAMGRDFAADFPPAPAPVAA